MTNQTAVITGASRGLGAAAARIAGQMKANVALMARTEGDLETVAKEVRAAGGQALPLVGDVGRNVDCKRAIAETIKAFGRIDVLVNNAGRLMPISPIASGDPQEWGRNWAVNVLGPVMLTQNALPYLRQSKGRVINISGGVSSGVSSEVSSVVSSGAAVSAIQGWGAFCVAKAGLNQFTRILAVEEPDITSISFRPGVVDTAMQATIRRDGAQGMPEEVYARFARYHEEGELLPPEVPGCPLAVLAFHAPHEWSGAFLAWNDEQVRALVRQFGCSYGA
jgi:NAD(P)-dependent dehydrogenase (short-subunit alcohol dehydrogenase family)